jgi:RNA polymerase sporulation-specific sigma factor
MGDKIARNKLIEHNLRLVAHIVKKFDYKNIDQDDLISIGTIGLIKGVDSFSKSHGTKITTYCARCIENEILMYFRSNKKYGNDVSLNDYIGVDKDGNSISLIDVIQDEDVDLSIKISNAIDIEALIKYLDVLKKQEREIIIKRYGLFNSKEYTQKEIAHEMGISRSYVSRIEKKALYKLLREFNKTK